MIQQTTFLGISLRTAAHRRTLVILYYFVLLLFLAIGLWKQHLLGYGIIIQTINLGGLFGGIRANGPVKYFGENAPVPGESQLQQLNLSGIFPRQPSSLLDERELHARDRAHYNAYRILRWSLCITATLYILGMNYAPKFLTNNAPNLLWALVVFVLSLPQSVILWTEPEPLPDSTLTLVPTSVELS